MYKYMILQLLIWHTSFIVSVYLLFSLIIYFFLRTVEFNIHHHSISELVHVRSPSINWLYFCYIILSYIILGHTYCQDICYTGIVRQFLKKKRKELGKKPGHLYSQRYLIEWIRYIIKCRIKQWFISLPDYVMHKTYGEGCVRILKMYSFLQIHNTIQLQCIWILNMKSKLCTTGRRIQGSHQKIALFFFSSANLRSALYITNSKINRSRKFKIRFGFIRIQRILYTDLLDATP